MGVCKGTIFAADLNPVVRSLQCMFAQLGILLRIIRFFFVRFPRRFMSLSDNSMSCFWQDPQDSELCLPGGRRASHQILHGWPRWGSRNSKRKQKTKGGGFPFTFVLDACEVV